MCRYGSLKSDSSSRWFGSIEPALRFDRARSVAIASSLCGGTWQEQAFAGECFKVRDRMTASSARQLAAGPLELQRQLVVIQGGKAVGALPLAGEGPITVLDFRPQRTQFLDFGSGIGGVYERGVVPRGACRPGAVGLPRLVSSTPAATMSEAQLYSSSIA